MILDTYIKESIYMSTHDLLVQLELLFRSFTAGSIIILAVLMVFVTSYHNGVAKDWHMKLCNILQGVILTWGVLLGLSTFL